MAPITTIAQDADAEYIYNAGVKWVEELNQTVHKNFRKSIPEWTLPNLCGPYAKANISVGDVGFIAVPFKVFQVVDKTNLLIEVGKGNYAWLSDVDTSMATDDLQALIANPVLVVGNKTYPTLLAQKTVIELRVLPEKECRKALDLWQRSKWTMRTWKDATGDFSVEGKLVGFNETEVELQKEDGSKIKVDKSKLGAGDKAWIKKNTFPLKFQIEKLK
ncbi:MAG: SHD1 domain-containing protein [Pirellulales bacterium]